jgi:hypothetical protein
MSLVLRSIAGRPPFEGAPVLDSSYWEEETGLDGPSLNTRPPCRGEIDIFNINYILLVLIRLKSLIHPTIPVHTYITSSSPSSGS